MNANTQRSSEILALQGRLHAARARIGAQNLPQAKELYQAKERTVQCCFCESWVEVKWTKLKGFTVPLGFIHLPDGILGNGNSEHLCNDCLRVNMGLTQDELSAIMTDVTERVKSGTAFEIAIEDAILTWAYANLFVAGQSPLVRQAVRKQLEAYGEDGTKDTKAYGATRQAADLKARAESTLKL